MKKTISILLSVIMVFSVICISVSAEEANRYYVGETYFEYSINEEMLLDGADKIFEGKTLFIHNFSEDFSRKLVVPDLIGEEKIENVVIEDYRFIETLVLSDGIKRFACYDDQGDGEHMRLKDRAMNPIRFIYLGKEFVEEGLYFSKTNSFARLENLERIYVSQDNPYLAENNGFIYTKDYKKIVMLPEKCKKQNSIYPKTGVTEITYSAFENVKSFEEIKHFKKIKKIGNEAFKNSGLNILKIYASTSSIGESAFADCKKLKTVTFYGDTNKTIGRYAFLNCKKLSKVKIKSTLPKIKKSAFANTKSGIKFYVKNKKVAKNLKRQLKGSGVKNAKIYVGKNLVYKDIK